MEVLDGLNQPLAIGNTVLRASFSDSWRRTINFEMGIITRISSEGRVTFLSGKDGSKKCITHVERLVRIFEQ